MKQVPSLEEQQENDRKARVNAVWEKMNSGVSAKVPTTLMNKITTSGSSHTPKANHSWMATLGFASKKTLSASQDNLAARHAKSHNETSKESKKLAADALSAVKDVTSAAAAAASGRGKVEITVVRDFAGEEIQVKKLVDADSKEAAEKAAKMTGAPPSALDSILEQIKKKQKLSVLDKTKKDWGEFKGERTRDWRRSWTPTRRARINIWRKFLSCRGPILESSSVRGTSASLCSRSGYAGTQLSSKSTTVLLFILGDYGITVVKLE